MTPGDVARYHAVNAGITEDLLSPARDAAGRNPYEWLVDAFPRAGLVVDLACGSAPLADHVGTARYVGFDLSASELSQARTRRPAIRVARADALAVPVRGPVAGVAVSMALMLLDLDLLLAEAARLLPGGGVLAAIIPTRDVPAGRPYRALLDAMGLTGRPYPTDLASDGLGAWFAGAGLLLTHDETVEFDRPLCGPRDVALVLRSFYAPPATEDAALLLGRMVTRGRDVLPYPIRRLVAVRSC